MLETLQIMAHKIHTAWGTSDGYGPDDSPFPLQGILQGNGAGPCIWLVISVIVFSMMRDEGFGMKFITPWTREKGHIVGFAIVDDADLAESQVDVNATGPNNLVQAQKALDHWEGGIRATGGAIVPDKSHWYYVDFEWKQGKWSYVRFRADRVLTVLNEFGTRVDVDQVPLNEARRTLGVYLAPDGSNTQMKQILLEKAKEWAEQIRVRHLGRKETWRALSSTIMQTIEYPLLSATFTQQDTMDIMKPILKQGLSQSGLANTFPRQVLYSPKKFLGLGLKDPYTSQNIKQILALLTYFESPCMTGQLLRLNWESLL